LLRPGHVANFVLDVPLRLIDGDAMLNPAVAQMLNLETPLGAHVGFHCAEKITFAFRRRIEEWHTDPTVSRVHEH